jgi:hypothetical protein
MRFLGSSKDNGKSKSTDPALQSEATCAHCTTGKTAKLLLLTGAWNFYYCYRCRQWSRSHHSATGTLFPVEDKRTENSLMWYWRTETEIMEENIRSMDWIRSLFFGKSYDEEKRSELA